jgi:hypothetical protein
MTHTIIFYIFRGTVPASLLNNFKEATDISTVQLNRENWTLITFPSSEAAVRSQSLFPDLFFAHNYTFHLAHWTTGNTLLVHVMVDAQNKAPYGRQRAVAGDNNIKTLLAHRRTVPRNLMILLPSAATRPSLCSVHPP